MKTKTMTIYIASSWKNQHGVEMLTTMLREKGYEVISWIENNYEEGYASDLNKEFDFEKWMQTENSNLAFYFDTEGARNCDLLIYYGPAGKDAAAETAMAYASGVPIIGLYAKGEDFGLMRKMMKSWHGRYQDLLKEVDLISLSLSEISENAEL